MQILSLFAIIITGLLLGLLINLFADILPGDGRLTCIHCGADQRIGEYFLFQRCSYCRGKHRLRFWDCNGFLCKYGSDLLDTSTRARWPLVGFDPDGVFWCCVCNRPGAQIDFKIHEHCRDISLRLLGLDDARHKGYPLGRPGRIWDHADIVLFWYFVHQDFVKQTGRADG